MSKVIVKNECYFLGAANTGMRIRQIPDEVAPYSEILQHTVEFDAELLGKKCLQLDRRFAALGAMLASPSGRVPFSTGVDKPRATCRIAAAATRASRRQHVAARIAAMEAETRGGASRTRSRPCDGVHDWGPRTTFLRWRPRTASAEWPGQMSRPTSSGKAELAVPGSSTHRVQGWPRWCSNARRLPLLNAEKVVEGRWVPGE